MANMLQARPRTRGQVRRRLPTASRQDNPLPRFDKATPRQAHTRYTTFRRRERFYRGVEENWNIPLHQGLDKMSNKRGSVGLDSLLSSFNDLRVIP